MAGPSLPMSVGSSSCFQMEPGDQSNIRFWDVDYAIHEGLEIDDDGFLRELALYMQNKENTDPDRIFVTGFSNGGDMCYQLACRESETFMSFAPVTGTMMDTLFTSCDPAVPHSIWTMNGLDDPVVLYEGDMDNSDGWGPTGRFRKSSSSGATCLGMTDMESTYLPDVDPDDGSIVREDIYSSPQHDRELWYYLVIGGGHEWPGQSGNRDIDATLAIWNFFDGLPGEPCTPGEFNGDHVVDVMDMLLVISQWDNPYTVVDLLTVIGHWDSICTFPGACCLPDGTCDYIESVDCQAVGGDWKGARSSCTTTSCAVTVNDECTGAIPVTNGATEFSTADATTSADAVDESQCPDTWLGRHGQRHLVLVRGHVQWNADAQHLQQRELRTRSWRCTRETASTRCRWHAMVTAPTVRGTRHCSKHRSPRVVSTWSALVGGMMPVPEPGTLVINCQE